MGFQMPQGYRPRGPEEGGQPAPVNPGAEGVMVGFAFAGVMAAGIVGLAAGEAQLMVEGGVMNEGILNDVVRVLAEPLVRAQVMYDVSPFVAMVVGELLIGAVVIAANSAIEAFVTRKNF